MKKWESLVLSKCFHRAEEIQKFRNQMGQKHWEPVSMMQCPFTSNSEEFLMEFKREILESHSAEAPGPASTFQEVLADVATRSGAPIPQPDELTGDNPTGLNGLDVPPDNE